MVFEVQEVLFALLGMHLRLLEVVPLFREVSPVFRRKVLGNREVLLPFRRLLLEKPEVLPKSRRRLLKSLEVFSPKWEFPPPETGAAPPEVLEAFCRSRGAAPEASASFGGAGGAPPGLPEAFGNLLPPPPGAGGAPHETSEMGFRRSGHRAALPIRLGEPHVGRNP